MFYISTIISIEISATQGQGRNLSDNWGGGVFIHTFVLCPTDFFSDQLKFKRIRPAEHGYMNNLSPPPRTNIVHIPSNCYCL